MEACMAEPAGGAASREALDLQAEGVAVAAEVGVVDRRFGYREAQAVLAETGEMPEREGGVEVGVPGAVGAAVSC